ncbi:holin [Hafnia alvei]|uniref:holin n=1 Tax=Hafnia alvei TaxID=569 RepID=UPI002DBFB2FD|nr:holin [Hafnia alvei]MEB7892034.1 holin [Hafnia alvei]
MQPETEALALAVAFSVFSGIGVYLQGVREKRISGGVMDLLTELSMSVSAGLVAYYLAQHQVWDKPLMFIAVIAASNNGQEVLTGVKEKIFKLLDHVLGSKK